MQWIQPHIGKRMTIGEEVIFDRHVPSHYFVVRVGMTATAPINMQGLLEGHLVTSISKIQILVGPCGDCYVIAHSSANRRRPAAFDDEGPPLCNSFRQPDFGVVVINANGENATHRSTGNGRPCGCRK